MKVEPRRADGPRLVPPDGAETTDRGIREGDDGDFLIKVWRMAYGFAEEMVSNADSTVIADKIMDAVGEKRRQDPTNLHNPSQLRAYVLGAVVRETKAVCIASQNQARLEAVFADLIESNTAARPIAAPDAVEAGQVQEREMSELMRYVSQEVAGLPDKCQEVVFLTYFEGLKQREIARIVEIKPDSVNSHLKRAKARIRKAVRQYLIDHPRETTI